MIRIRADFNAQDRERRIRLDTRGSMEDIARLGAEVTEGARVLVYDEGDIEAEGILELVEGTWRARLVEGSLRRYRDSQGEGAGPRGPA